MIQVYGYKLEIANEESPPNMHKYFLIAEDTNDYYYEYIEFRDDQKYILLLRYMILVHLHLSGNSSSEGKISLFNDKYKRTIVMNIT